MTVVRFMLVMPWGRVGSNLLFAILRQSAPMKLANETFNTLKTAREQEAWFHDFYEVAGAPPDRKYIGSKQSVRAMRDLPIMEGLLRDHSVRVVRLRRDNIVKAAISQIRAEQYAKQTERETGVGAWAVKKGDVPLGPTEIDPNVLVPRTEIMEKFQSSMMNSFQGIDVLDIEYEEINSSLDDVVTRMRDFLGAPQSHFKVPFEKATPDNLRTAIANYSEVMHTLENTRFAQWAKLD